MSKKILVIDDEQDLLELLVEFFELEDFNVSASENGTKALEYLKSDHFDAIVCDESLPDINGHTILEEVLKLEKKPLFSFSSGSVKLTEEGVQKEGVSGLFSKPFNIDEVVELVKKKLEG